MKMIKIGFPFQRNLTVPPKKVIHACTRAVFQEFYFTPTTALCLHNLQHVSTAVYGHHQGVNCRQHAVCSMLQNGYYAYTFQGFSLVIWNFFGKKKLPSL
jgi:hypothetical protein